MMKFICAPDSFKDSMSAARAAEQMALGIGDVLGEGEIDVCPISDGGEGFAQAVGHSLGAQSITTRVTGPRGGDAHARWFFAPADDQHPATAIIEMATASGLELLTDDQRDPTRTTTFGTGELMRAGIERGAKRIVMGIGGSATNDFACGAAQALKARFYDAADREMSEPVTGGELGRIARVDVGAMRDLLGGIEVIVACDVTNPLAGPHGAAHVYAPQKGADSVKVRQLDDGLRHIAGIVRDQLGTDVCDTPGAGAAGGMGGGAIAFFRAALKPGIELVLETVDFDRRVAGCALCLTGEGKLDGQSLSGKACLGVAKAAAKHDVPTYALIGVAGDQIERTRDAGLAGYRVIGPGLRPEESMRRGEELLRQATRRLMGELNFDAAKSNV